MRGGRLVVDRIQTFDGIDGREGITLGLGAPTAGGDVDVPRRPRRRGPDRADRRVQPQRRRGRGRGRGAARRPRRPTACPSPSSSRCRPAATRSSNLHEEERIPAGVGHSTIVRSLNGVPVVAERAVAAGEGATRRGVAATLGAPLGRPHLVLPRRRHVGRARRVPHALQRVRRRRRSPTASPRWPAARTWPCRTSRTSSWRRAPASRSGSATTSSARTCRSWSSADRPDRGRAGPLPRRRRRHLAGHGHPAGHRRLRPRRWLAEASLAAPLPISRASGARPGGRRARRCAPARGPARPAWPGAPPS